MSGDFDNDGDQDLFEQLGGAYPFDGYGNALWENPGNQRKWLTLRLVGRQANRFGVGARQEFFEVPCNRFFQTVEGEDELTPLELPLLRFVGRNVPANRKHVHRGDRP